MLIPLSGVDARSPSSLWASIFGATWWLTIAFAVIVAIAPPIDFFVPAAGRVGSTGWDDRIANVVAVVLLQNVVLAFILLAAHVTRLLESIAASVAKDAPDGMPSPRSVSDRAVMKGQVSIRPNTASVPSDGDLHDWEGNRWECSSCGAPNGLLDRWNCWRCKAPKPKPDDA